MTQPSRQIDTPSSVHERVNLVLDRIRPVIQEDGGDVELVEVTDQGVARIRLHGACVGCPSSSMTLHMGIERTLREMIPEVTGVEQVD
ncbi:MAG: NifU family protein [Phycisphaeraceae bacterium]